MKLARWLWLAAGAAGLGIVAYGLGAQPSSVPTASTDPKSSVSTALVERRTLSSHTQVEGTLGYTGDYSVVNHLAGYFTWLPPANEGTVVAPGEVLYRVGTVPIVLLPGSIPAWRDLSRGDSGSDVEQLNLGLVKLGFLDSNQLESPQTFGPATEEAIRALQRKIGANASGALPLGHAASFPSPLRVVSVLPVLGARAEANSVIVKATSISRRVKTSVSASRLKRIQVGDEVTITLNFGGVDQRAIAGTVSKLSPAAKPGSASNDLPLFEVEIIPSPESPLGNIDQMPVLVGFTEASAAHALVVPITALLSTPPGFAVEVLGPGGSRLVPVQLGVFSDAAGLVQVIGEGLEAGDEVVVPGL